MATLRLLPIVLLLALLCFNACDDDDPLTGSGGGGGNNGHSSFPSSVGMLWKYEVYDSLTETVDTVWVSVTGHVLYGPDTTGYSWRIYWRSSGEVEDRAVFRGVESDTVEVWKEAWVGSDALELFVMPFEDGMEWTSRFTGDTSRTTIRGSVTVPAGRFTGVARVDRVWRRDIEGGGKWSETWLDEEAGIVKRHFLSQFSDGASITVTQNETWELVEYDLTTFSLQQFPNTIGTEWVYEVLHMGYIDNDTLLVDTVTVTVVNYLFPENIPAPWEVRAVWEYAGKENIDTSIVQVGHGIVTMHYDTLQSSPPAPFWSYRFPMAVGEYWGADILDHVPHVYDKTNVSSPAGTFETVFCYSMTYGMPGSWIVYEQLAPGVGVVTRVFYPYTGGYLTGPEKWTLLSFDPAP